MTPAPTPATNGRHGLGPHVVGRRVVVRRIVPGETGPTGGPAFTDVLGVCERWSDGEAVVRREDGTSITIEISMIVAGKPVPPRASRLARISQAEIEAHLDAPAEQVWLGSVSQLSRNLAAADPEQGPEQLPEQGPEQLPVQVEIDDAGDRQVAGFEHRGARASAVLDGGWVRVDRLPVDRDLLAAVVEWAAESGIGIVAVTDPAAAVLLEELGFLNRPRC